MRSNKAIKTVNFRLTMNIAVCRTPVTCEIDYMTMLSMHEFSYLGRQSARPVLRRSWVRFLSGLRFFSLSEALIMLINFTFYISILTFKFIIFIRLSKAQVFWSYRSLSVSPFCSILLSCQYFITYVIICFPLLLKKKLQVNVVFAVSSIQSKLVVCNVENVMRRYVLRRMLCTCVNCANLSILDVLFLSK